MNSKLKVALCISGQPRFYNRESYDSLKREILDKYNTDVFIHSWVSSDNTYEYPHATWSNIKTKITVPSTVRTDLLQLYTPVQLTVEEPKKFERHIKGDYLSANMPSMFYSMMMADNERKKYSSYKQMNYDFVIRARTDTLLLSPLPDLSLLDKNTVYVPDNCGNPTLFNENFSIAGGDVADKVYDIYNYIDKYTEGRDYSPERMWTIHLSLNNITVRKMDVSQSFVRE